ncbi:TPA: hypothetical protein ACH3X2_005690 [Trebouxia sp. C0005]
MVPWPFETFTFTMELDLELKCSFPVSGNGRRAAAGPAVREAPNRSATQRSRWWILGIPRTNRTLSLHHTDLQKQVAMSGPQAVDSWYEVGPRGKHKHVPRQHHEPDCQHLLSPHVTHQPPDAVGVSDSKELQKVFDLTLLPGTALACIFNNLDSCSAFSLAKTCRACASEFAQQKSEVAKRCLAELTPTVTCTLRGDHDEVGRDDVRVPSLSFAVHWKDSSKDAIYRIYHLSQKPGFWRSFWNAVWPTFQWSETLGDGLPISTYEQDGGYVHDSYNSVHVDMLMESNQKLYVSWEWLHGHLLDSFAAVLLEALWAARSWPPGEHRIYLRMRLYRPAKDGRFHEVVHRVTDCGSPDSDYLETFSVQPNIWSEYYQSPIAVRPAHMQRVTVTGPWCRWLPNADWPLWHAHHGDSMQGTVVGDLFRSPLKPFMGYADSEDDIYAYDPYYDYLTEIAEEQSLKPFTCEVNIEPCWYNY